MKKPETEGTKISKILKQAECKNCKNKNIEKFTIYFEMDIVTRQVKKYLYCDECDTVHEVKEIEVREYLLEPTISTAG